MVQKNQRINIRLDKKTYDWIENYKQEKELLYFSDAVIDLINFAIRIKENAKGDDSISNRELLEEILKHVLVAEQAARTSLGYAYIEGKLKDAELVGKVKGIISGIEQKAEIDKSSILTKE